MAEPVGVGAGGGPEREVQVVEVGLRDGLQSFSRVLSIEEKLTLLRALRASGLTHVELGAFVRPDRVPEMADSDELFRIAREEWPEAELIGLVLNERGAERAVAAGATSLRMVISASEGHSAANSGRSVEQSVREAARVLESVEIAHGPRVSVELATAFVCPFDGVTSAEQVVELASLLAAAGYQAIGLADTLGRANPRQVARTLDAVRTRLPDVELSLHLHDTFGMALANVIAALEVGVRTFDAAIGGIGGCPFAPGARGNIATEDLVFLLQEMGFSPGIGVETVAESVRAFHQVLGADPESSVARAMGWIDDEAVGAVAR